MIGTPGPEATGEDRDLAGYHVMLAAVLYKRAVLIVRYPIDTFASLVSMYVFWALVFFGGREAAMRMGSSPQALAPTLEGLIVGWFLWTMASIAYAGLPQNVTREASWGTLEQLYMSPYGFGSVMASMVVANVLQSLLWGGGILSMMLLSTGRSLTIDLVTIVPVSFLTLLSVVGVGFLFAGLAIVYKRIGNVSQLMPFVLVGLVAAPAAGLSPLRFLPLVQGSAMLQETMRHGTRLWQFPALDLGVLVLTAIGYFMVGYWTFLRLSRLARDRGVMGHY
ncbi:MAG: ABC-2 type transport system permease protein [Halobacteriales archaeon]|jgi:ABC-2 type transport system permease protein